MSTGRTAPKIENQYVAANVDDVADHHKQINVWETLAYLLSVSSMHSVLNIQWLPKVFIPLERLHILSRYNHKHKCILLGFYVIDQHKVAEWKKSDT